MELGLIRYLTASVTNERTNQPTNKLAWSQLTRPVGEGSNTVKLMSNTRRRCDSTVELRRVGGVYWA